MRFLKIWGRIFHDFFDQKSHGALVSFWSVCQQDFQWFSARVHKLTKMLDMHFISYFTIRNGLCHVWQQFVSSTDLHCNVKKTLSRNHLKKHQFSTEKYVKNQNCKQMPSGGAILTPKYHKLISKWSPNGSTDCLGRPGLALDGLFKRSWRGLV